MFYINTLIEWETETNKGLERILWMNMKDDIAFVIDINTNDCPFQRTISEVKNFIYEGFVHVLDTEPYMRTINNPDISYKERQIRDNAWKVINEMVTLEPQIYYPKERRKLIREAAKTHKISELTVLNYLKRYWQRGMTINALIPDYLYCGGKGKEKVSGDAKRGRPRKYIDVSGVGININNDLKRIFRTAINRFYHTSAKNSLALTYELMRKEYFSELRIENGTKVPILKPNAEVPTFGQFRYWFEKNSDIKKLISSRNSIKKYQQEYRPIIGNSTREAEGPGSKYQIDATVGDVYLVSRFNKNWIIGRPVIYYAMDVFSREIVGIYIGLEGPSWAGAMSCLANACIPKVDYCADFGLQIQEEDWPVHFLPECILADRGELEGAMIHNCIESLNVKVQNTSPYRPDFKGIIEQYFRTTNLKVKPFLPGVVNSEVRERGEKDYRLDATLTIYEFTQIIIKCALYHNNSHHLDDYIRDDDMIADDIQCIPRELWNWGIKNRAGKLRQVAEDIVKLNLMPSGDATVTPKGIKFKGMYYGSKMILKEKWLEKSRFKGSWRIKVSYDSRNMNYIYIRNDSGNGFEKCDLLEHQGRYRDKTIEEILYFFENEKIQKGQTSDGQLQSKIDLISEIEDIVKKSKTASKNQVNAKESDAKRKKGIRTNRKIEKLINRENEAFILGKDVVPESNAVLPFSKQLDDTSDNICDVELLKKKQKEGLKKLYE